MEGTRLVIVTIDTLMEIFKAYSGELQDIPTDAKAVKLMFKPTDMGKLKIVAESEGWKEGLPPIQIRFDIKRIHSVAN
jgi:hypothetical protein